jgi:putative hydrolase of HD superfamily
MYALILAEHAQSDIDVIRMIKMLLIHDIVEIEAGDTPLHGSLDFRSARLILPPGSNRPADSQSGSMSERCKDPTAAPDS